MPLKHKKLGYSYINLVFCVCFYMYIAQNAQHKIVINCTAIDIDKRKIILYNK